MRTTKANISAIFATLGRAIEKHYGIPQHDLVLHPGNSSTRANYRVCVSPTGADITGPLGCTTGEAYRTMSAIARSLDILNIVSPREF